MCEVICPARVLIGFNADGVLVAGADTYQCRRLEGFWRRGAAGEGGFVVLPPAWVKVGQRARHGALARREWEWFTGGQGVIDGDSGPAESWCQTGRIRGRHTPMRLPQQNELLGVYVMRTFKWQRVALSLELALARSSCQSRAAPRHATEFALWAPVELDRR